MVDGIITDNAAIFILIFC